MGCCGKAKSVLVKGKRIAVGFTNYTRGKKFEFTDGRIRKCKKCDESTWMSKVEYSLWLIKYGIKNPVAVTTLQLDKLPKLPKHEQSRTRRCLYCRICKCFIPGKASVENEKCLLKRWPKLKGAKK